MTSPLSLKAKQNDLRKLMKERRENLKEQKIKIDSPFAKYNSAGQLLCLICNIQVKNNGLWASHVAGKIHKENALKRKKGNADIDSNTIPRTAEKRSEIQPPAIKKLKVESKEPPQPPKSEISKALGKISLLDAYSSSSEDESDTSKPASNITSNNTLPADFFDAASSNTADVEQLHVDEKPSIKLPSVPAEAIPEGFFDDPVLDAKARNVEYKDPVEEEWERYQKAIAEETNVSKSIIEEDLEESTLERDIVQIDEQIQHWERIKNLQTLADEIKAKVPSKSKDGNSSGSTDDELEEDDLLDWRSKGVKR